MNKKLLSLTLAGLMAIGLGIPANVYAGGLTGAEGVGYVAIPKSTGPDGLLGTADDGVSVWEAIGPWFDRVQFIRAGSVTNLFNGLKDGTYDISDWPVQPSQVDEYTDSAGADGVPRTADDVCDSTGVIFGKGPGYACAKDPNGNDVPLTTQISLIPFAAIDQWELDINNGLYGANAAPGGLADGVWTRAGEPTATIPGSAPQGLASNDNGGCIGPDLKLGTADDVKGADGLCGTADDPADGVDDGNEFRIALQHLFDKDGHIANNLKGNGEPHETPMPIPAACEWVPPELKTAAQCGGGTMTQRPYPYSPSTAATILASLHYGRPDTSGPCDAANAARCMQDLLPGSASNGQPVSLKILVRSDDPLRTAMARMLRDELILQNFFILAGAALNNGAYPNSNYFELPRRSLFFSVFVFFSYHIYTGGWGLGRGLPDLMFSLYNSKFIRPFLPNYQQYRGTGFTIGGKSFDDWTEDILAAATTADITPASYNALRISAHDAHGIWAWVTKLPLAYRLVHHDADANFHGTLLKGIVNTQGSGIIGVASWFNGYFAKATGERLGGGTLKYGWLSEPQAVNMVHQSFKWDFQATENEYEGVTGLNPTNFAFSGDISSLMSLPSRQTGIPALSFSVNVDASRVASFSITACAGCSSYDWSFGDGGTLSTASLSASHTYTNDGVKQATLAGKDGSGTVIAAAAVTNLKTNLLETFSGTGKSAIAIYTFSLVPRGIKWHDGHAFDSGDIRFSMQYVKLYEGWASPGLDDLVYVDTPNTNTARAFTSASGILQRANLPIPIIPQHIWGPDVFHPRILADPNLDTSDPAGVAIDSNGDGINDSTITAQEALTGTGAFKWNVRTEPFATATVLRNTDYHAGARGLYDFHRQGQVTWYFSVSNCAAVPNDSKCAVGTPDYKINVVDLAAIGIRFTAQRGVAPPAGVAAYNRNVDLNEDAVINVVDLAKTGANFGASFLGPAPPESLDTSQFGAYATQTPFAEPGVVDGWPDWLPQFGTE